MNEIINEIKDFWKALNKFHFCNAMLITSTLASVVIAFAIQFKVESLQDKMVETQAQIAFYHDQISLLEVEWTYQTRPERLRDLASRYLKDNGYTLASQIKNNETMEKYYLANYQRGQELAVNVNDDIHQISF